MVPNVVTILGCTASGKGAVARALAQRLGAEIVSLDSMKVYRGLDIGTAKPSPAERASAPHHLVDVVDPWESFSAARYVSLADAAIQQITARGNITLLVGGSMMYFRFLYEGCFDAPPADAELRSRLRARAEHAGVETLHAELAAVDPVAAERIHRTDLRRIERALEVHALTGRRISELQTQWDRGMRKPSWNWRLFGLRRPREEANARINQRVKRMLSDGLVDEVRRLWMDPRGLSPEASQAVGYREIIAHFERRCGLNDAVEQIKVDSRHLAKQQRNWLRRIAGLRCLDLTPEHDADQAASQIAEWLEDASATQPSAAGEL